MESSKQTLQLEAYTDGSYDSNYGVYGGGIVVIINDNSTPLDMRVYGNKPEYASYANAAGELLAVMKAIELALEVKATSLKIYYDFMGVRNWTLPRGTPEAWRPKRALMKAYAVYVHQAKQQGLLIAYEHVKSHTGHPLNERADALAKEAVKECIRSLGIL